MIATYHDPIVLAHENDGTQREQWRAQRDTAGHSEHSGHSGNSGARRGHSGVEQWAHRHEWSYARLWMQRIRLTGATVPIACVSADVSECGGTERSLTVGWNGRSRCVVVAVRMDGWRWLCGWMDVWMGVSTHSNGMNETRPVHQLWATSEWSPKHELISWKPTTGTKDVCWQESAKRRLWGPVDEHYCPMCISLPQNILLSYIWMIGVVWIFAISTDSPINRQRRLSTDIIIPFERKNTTINSKYLNIVDAMLVSICFAFVTILAFSLSQKSHRIFIISFCPTTLRSYKWLLPSFLLALTHTLMFWRATLLKQ